MSADEIAVVCTDRGQHKRERLSTLTMTVDGQLVGITHRGDKVHSPLNWGGAEGTAISMRSYTFRCPKCPRRPKIEHGRWWELVRAARRAALPEIDVSHLD